MFYIFVMLKNRKGQTPAQMIFFSLPLYERVIPKSTMSKRAQDFQGAVKLTDL